MKYHTLFVIFEKSGKILNCSLLQIIGGVLWVRQVLLYTIGLLLSDIMGVV